MEYQKQQFLTYDEFTRQFACDYAMPLARGGHGEIYRGVDLETNEEVAIKRRLYSVDDNALTLEKEYAHTQAVPVNRFVVRYLYYGRYVTPFGTYEFLVMRYYRDGNLTNTALSWATLTSLQQQRFIGEFLLGLLHLHTHGIVHRDIKPENVLLVRYSDPEGIAFRPVIVDFGISKMMTDYPEAARAFVQNSMRIGTVTYMAPEQLRTENIDYNADLWSFGIILYELITGKHMIARKSFPETQREEAYAFWRQANEERFPDDLRTVPQPYQQIIRKCLIVSPEERIQSARALLDLLDLQPRIDEAEQAFRRQQWETVIETLEPIVDRAEIPELEHWLQQARMQQAFAQPASGPTTVPVAREPEPAPEVDNRGGAPADSSARPVPADEGADQPAPVIGKAVAGEEPPKLVPYTAQTELLDEPAQAVPVPASPVHTPPEQGAKLPDPAPATAVYTPESPTLGSLMPEREPETAEARPPAEPEIPPVELPIDEPVAPENSTAAEFVGEPVAPQKPPADEPVYLPVAPTEAFTEHDDWAGGLPIADAPATADVVGTEDALSVPAVADEAHPSTDEENPVVGDAVAEDMVETGVPDEAETSTPTHTQQTETVEVVAPEPDETEIDDLAEEAESEPAASTVPEPATSETDERWLAGMDTVSVTETGEPAGGEVAQPHTNHPDLTTVGAEEADAVAETDPRHIPDNFLADDRPVEPEREPVGEQEHRTSDAKILVDNELVPPDAVVTQLPGVVETDGIVGRDNNAPGRWEMNTPTLPGTNVIPANGRPVVAHTQQAETVIARAPQSNGTTGQNRSAASPPAGPVPTDESARKRFRIPSAATRLPEVILPRLKKTISELPVDELKDQFREWYDKARKSKNRPLIVGVAVIGLLTLLFAINPGAPVGEGELDPNESYAVAQKRCQNYIQAYIKTGEVNPYIWAFKHCNPIYADSLAPAARKRAEVVAAQYQLLFPDYVTRPYQLRDWEIRYLSRAESSWDQRERKLSDENCLPIKR